MTISELVSRWQSRRDEYARLGVLLDGAKLAAEILEDLHELETQEADELLTLTDAGRDFGLHPDSIGRAIREGRIPNCGRKNAPRVKRSDVARLTERRRSITKFGDQTGARPAVGASLGAVTRNAIASKLPVIRRG